MQKKGKSADIAIIGNELTVVEADNPQNKGLTGKAIDETRNTILIATKDGNKKLIKDKVTIKVKGNIIEGKKLSGRIEERIKNS